jgi:general secretion pathway protein H
MCSASAPTVNPGAKARTPISVLGNRPELGFTLIELLVVVALIGIVAGMVSLSLRDPSVTRLEQEGARLSTLLEAARSEARASHLAARWEINRGNDPGDFRFVGLPSSTELPNRWLSEGVSAEIVGARALTLGPEPLIGAQRVVLHLGERQLAVATDGLAPFAVEEGR